MVRSESGSLPIFRALFNFMGINLVRMPDDAIWPICDDIWKFQIF